MLNRAVIKQQQLNHTVKKALNLTLGTVSCFCFCSACNAPVKNTHTNLLLLLLFCCKIHHGSKYRGD